MLFAAELRGCLFVWCDICSPLCGGVGLGLVGVYELDFHVAYVSVLEADF
jgi:hypothetical protein